MPAKQYQKGCPPSNFLEILDNNLLCMYWSTLASNPAPTSAQYIGQERHYFCDFFCFVHPSNQKSSRPPKKWNLGIKIFFGNLKFSIES